MDLKHVKFRNANVKDISNIMNIEYNSFSREICEKKEIFLERIEVFSEGFRIMEYDNKIIGYICSEIWKYNNKINKEYFILGHSIKKNHVFNNRELYISSMGLLPEYRGKSLGKFMFNSFINYIKTNFLNIDSIILIVSEKWKKAIKIYIANGFENSITIENFFTYGVKKKHYEDGIVMRKKVNHI